MEIQLDVNEVIEALTAHVANLAKENAILKAQVKAMTVNKEEKKNAKK